MGTFQRALRHPAEDIFNILHSLGPEDLQRTLFLWQINLSGEPNVPMPEAVVGSRTSRPRLKGTGNGGLIVGMWRIWAQWQISGTHSSVERRLFFRLTLYYKRVYLLPFDVFFTTILLLFDTKPLCASSEP